jgi:hypothetical protein
MLQLGLCQAFSLSPVSNRQYFHLFSIKNANDEQDILDRENLKDSLQTLARVTKRGFTVTSSQKREISDVISKLCVYNPSNEPASSFYEDNVVSKERGEDVGSIDGKWKLVYTTAPDITSLDTTTSPSLFPTLPSAKLGRIGQECSKEMRTIKNVIEWSRPDWISRLLEGAGEADNGGSSRVLQKVVCEASASPDMPSRVQLKLAGFELLGDIGNNDSQSQGQRSPLAFIKEGPAKILANNPVSLRGPLKAPFGFFDILYLDENMRIIKTGQGYLAVNVREDDEWF